MKNAAFLFFSLIVSTMLFSNTQARENPLAKMKIGSWLSRPVSQQKTSRSSNIKDIQLFGENSGIAFTDEKLFRTDDNGESWREIILPKSFDETISAVSFANENIGWAIVADLQFVKLELLKTTDGGNFWTRTPINLSTEDLAEADLVKANFGFENDKGWLKLELTSSSNFERYIYSTTNDGGKTWKSGNEQSTIREYEESFNTLEEFGDYFDMMGIEIQNFDSLSESIVKNTTPSLCAGPVERHSDWLLTLEGNCKESKTGCLQATKVYKIVSSYKNQKSTVSLKEITPPQIKELARIEKVKAELEAQNSVFAALPDGSTRISLNRGFDKCTAAPVSQMQTWWDNSPFYDSNIYISGRNRGCTQAQLTADWVNQVSAMGWGLIPTIVGYQAPCSVCANCQKHSSDPATAETQGRGEADIAIADANNLGLTRGTVLYYDMERYDDLSGTGACSTPVKAFLKGWTERLHEQGYISGVYGSPTNAVNDWINIPEASRMDAVWLARWNNVMSVWGVAPLPDNYWTNHQRIHQWLGPRNETWGGVTFNIDNNISDAPVAGVKIPKNKIADFDGDGKTDISVYRPETGGWYVFRSSNSSFYGVAFGSGADIPAPGDYDGDGKTDPAVFRPADSTWYFLTKAGTFSARQFGASGDIPVPADFNGDGKTDVAVFRPSNGTWYIANSDSLQTYTFIQFGQNGDKPVQADYDGDGKADIAVFRPSTGSWYLLKSSNGSFYGVEFGVSTDLPAQGDFDGDGKTDFAVLRGGTWYLLQTSAGFAAASFGTNGDLPVTGDYDGDGRDDVAVFRPSVGAWYLLQSQNGFGGMNFGISTDKPIPNLYLPQ